MKRFDPILELAPLDDRNINDVIIPKFKEVPLTEREARVHNNGFGKEVKITTPPDHRIFDPATWSQSKLNKIKHKGTLRMDTYIVKESVKVEDNVITTKIYTSGEKEAILKFHFFKNGIVKLTCVNPANPSKFSFEKIHKPDAVSYTITDKVSVGNESIEIVVPEAKAKFIINYKPFVLRAYSTKENKDELLFEMNPSSSLYFDENLTADFTFNSDLIYGLPEKPVDLILEDTRNGFPYRLYVQDVAIYPILSKNGTYATVPLILSRNRNSSTITALFWQNCSDTYVDIHKKNGSSKTFWLSERGNLECYIFVSPSPADYYRSFASVLGHCCMPQYFALGYHQARWSYLTQEEILEVNASFNKHEIPCDSIALDIDHTDGFRYFTFNLEKFPDPLQLQATLVADERELVTIADPHVKKDPKYFLYDEIASKGLCMRDKDKTPFVGESWPGECLYMDFMNEEARECWASQYSYDKYKFSTKNMWAWNDMNEPSCFRENNTNYMPLDTLHKFKSLDDPDDTFDVEHREVHNMYGLSTNMSTYLGMLRRNKDQNIRPYVLSRSFFAGTQKYCMIWTGDTECRWDYLKYMVPMILNISLCGVSFCGADVGGYSGDTEPELAVRGYQLAAFFPYFRGHSAKMFKRREPWVFKPKYAKPIKLAIIERYKLLPYWYTCFEEHCRTAVPVLRPIWLDQEMVEDYETMEEQGRFMVGNALLVVPVLKPGQTLLTDFLKGLKGRYYDYFDYKEVNGKEQLDVGFDRIGCFVKGGNIIPTFGIEHYVKSSKGARKCEIRLLVGLDEENKAKGSMYFDDGESFDFRKGTYERKIITFENNELRWESDGTGNGFEVKNKVKRVIIMGVGDKINSAYLVKNGKERKQLEVTKKDMYVELNFSAAAGKDWRIVVSEE